MNTKTTALDIPGVLLIESESYRDHRGVFLESYREARLAELGLPPMVQGNVSISGEGVLRGLHYQVTRPQGKLMRTVHGTTFNACVDMREGSPTLGKAIWTTLDRPELALWVPPGFANGFMALTEDTVVAYECSSYHYAGSDRALFAGDPDLRIPWPEITSRVMSDKDLVAPLFVKAERVPASECGA